MSRSAPEPVYLDHNATSPERPEVRALLAELGEEGLGNPSSLHGPGRRARHLVDEARGRVAAALGVHEEEVVFTSGGTESNALALLGALRPLGPAAGLVTTAVEHSSVLDTAGRLREEGHPVAVVPVDRAGLPDPERLVAAARDPGCRLVSVIAANNEVGAVPDLAALAGALEAAAGRPLLHTDAVQALGRVPLALGPLGEGGPDLATFSAHKVGGPIGVGLLVRRRGVALEPLAYGGGQEGGLRPGTENAPAIAAAALAVELAVREREDFAARTRALVSSLWEGVRDAVPTLRLFGPPLESTARLPNTLCVGVPDVDGKVLVTRLDVEGLAVGAGSACASGSLEPSHVLLAMGFDRDVARSGVRVSLGWNTTTQDCKRAVHILAKVFSGHAQRGTSATACAQPSKSSHKSR